MNSIVREATKDCEREDCRLTSSGGFSTSMAWDPTYNKAGERIGSDPNIRTAVWQCLACGREWLARTQDGKTTVTLREEPAKCR